eukprot:c8033_g1_i1 orf=1-171(-)
MHFLQSFTQASKYLERLHLIEDWLPASFWVTNNSTACQKKNCFDIMAALTILHSSFS